MTMTKTTIASVSLALALALGGGLSACNIHDNTATVNIPDATVNLTTTADKEDIMPMQAVPMVVDVKNVTLVDPAATPTPAQMADASHLVFTLDDESSPPLLVTAETNVSVTIPATTKAGPHKVICRVHKHDGTPTSTMVELDIMVKVSVTTTTNDAGTTTTTVDASVTIEAGVTTTN
jgi:hypothetical protein